MTEFINLQVYGVPIVTYGLVGLTTAVLAYATSISEMGEKMSESVSEMTEIPMEALNSMNPLAEKATSEEQESALSELNPFSSLDEKDPPPAEPFAGLKGGKRRNNKTPKIRQRNAKRQRGGKGKTKKNRQTKS